MLIIYALNFLFGETEECISNGGNDAFVFFYMSSLLL